MVKEPTCDPSASLYPFVVVVVALNPTQITGSIPANKKKITTNNMHIQISTYIT